MKRKIKNSEFNKPSRIHHPYKIVGATNLNTARITFTTKTNVSNTS
jgi:hypothetical protein